MKLPFLSSVSIVITRTGLYTCLVAMVLALSATGCSGGGGSSGGGLPPDAGPSPIPRLDDHGGSPFDATIIYPGQEITTGFINVVNDVDYFKFDLIVDQWYGIQNAAHTNGNYNQNINVPGGLLFQLLDSTGAVPIDNSSDWNWPEELTNPPGSAGKRLMWQSPYTGSFYYRLSHQFGNGIGAYAFKLATSQLAYSEPLHSGEHTSTHHSSSNIRSYVEIFEDGLPRLVGPATDSTDAQSNFLFGSVSVGLFGMPTFGSNWFSGSASVSTVTFLDDEGIPNTESEVSVWHLHYGTPSRDLSDGVDDIYWNDTIPNDNFQRDRNYQEGTPHPFILEGLIGDGLPNSVDASIMHMIIGLDWYIDVHITDNLDLYSIPIASSLPQGAIKMFDSSFFLNGTSGFPSGFQTDSAGKLEVAYDDEYQLFYLPYGDVLDHSDLVGATLHLHAGLPTEANGPLLLDLGTIPAVQSRPIYEDGSSFFPGIENVIYELSDAEAKLINDATYTTGWYLDLHTAPNFLVTPELRANGVLWSNLEVGVSRHASTPSLRSDGGSGIGSGSATFVTDDLTYGPILVKLNGKDIGQIDMADVDGEDLEGESASGELAPNTYRYVAYADGVVWSGHVDIQDGVDTNVVLNAADAQPQE